jgi:DAK2 domain fusion protein YloV
MVAPSDFIFPIVGAVKALADRRDEVNRLNVFPVPDGDTGTNMSLTLEAVLDELRSLPSDMTGADIRKAITHGSLMGARGNSGVITSQILRGICDGLAEAEHFDAATVSVALDKAVEVAFGAVRKPVEGTILTVLRDVADAARQQAAASPSLEDILSALRAAAYRSVKNTPELLPVLRENGVVDAGGYGLALLIDGFVSSIIEEGDATLERDVTLELGVGETTVGKVAIEQIDDWEGSAYLYCTEFLFVSDDLDVEATQEFLASMGDCELLVGAHPDFKVHVHTNEPGTVLSHMTQRGQVSEVHIHNMRLQSEGRRADLETREGARETADAPDAVKTTRTFGCIAVASGSGMKKILESLGVDEVISGGQTMNPSTKDLLDAAERIAADNIFILPNNKNIILAANAAAAVSSKRIEVIATKSVPQSFSALFALNQEASFEENTRLMNEAIAMVRFGEVTSAIKNAKTVSRKAIHKGDIIGLVNDSIEVVGKTVPAVTLEVVGILADGDVDTLTILAGADLAQDEFDRLLEEIESAYPDLELDAHRGEQPLYPLVMSAE